MATHNDVDITAEIRALNGRSSSGLKCDLSKVFLTLTKGEREGIRAAMDDKTIEAAAIARWLKAKGYTISDSAIRRCRRNCDCWRS